MSEGSLVGAWELVAMCSRSGDGETKRPYGDQPAGMLTYTEDGYMSAVLMRRDRTVTPSRDPEGTEPATGPEGFNAYCGTYSLDPSRGAVIHHVEASHIPDWVGSDQVRYFEMDGDMLSIWTDPVHADGRDWVRRLTWRARS